MDFALEAAHAELKKLLERQNEWEGSHGQHFDSMHFALAAPDAKGTSPRVEWTHAARPDACTLAILRHYGGEGSDPVLLLHGASAWRGTFFEPEGGLVRHLKERFQVWTLDWRASKTITQPWFGQPAKRVPESIRHAHLDHAVADLHNAVLRINQHHNGERPPRIVAHCMGAAVAALAIERGQIVVDPSAPGAVAPEVVLSGMGLFYRGGVDTWFRGQERAGEGPGGEPDTWYLDFNATWPEPFERVFSVWLKTPYPHCSVPFCQRISCSIGSPYRPDDIAYLHDDALGGICQQFGVMPITLLHHCAQNLRRGYAAAYNQDDTSEPGGQPRLDVTRFRDFAITLLTGSENQLWHRDSIDRMHEWLQRDPKVRNELAKYVLPEYGHQDLWWSRRSSQPDGVYDLVRRRLRPERASRRAPVP